MIINEIINQINDYLWSLLIPILVGLGLIFTISSNFVQFRYFLRMFKILKLDNILKKEKNEKGHLSSLQALILSVAGRVGAGNIVGVATAITVGGPGAVFWMWLVGLIGMATSFFECTLGQAYKRTMIDGTYRGGPAFYITYGLGKNWKWLASIFSILILVTYGFGFNSVQSYAVTNSLSDTFNLPIKYLSIIFVIIIAFVISGGIKRIVKIAEKLVPIMAIGYIILALIVLLINFKSIPDIFLLIINSAFGLNSAIGGGIGIAISQGVKRGLFSNEAGIGAAPNVAAVAHVSHPADQGVVQSFSVFIDTIIICSCTAFIILLGGIYNLETNQMTGIVLAQNSMANFIGEWGKIFISCAITLFAFTTIIYNYYLGENGLVWIGLNKTSAILIYRLLVIIICAWGANSDLSQVFSFADITMACLAIVNLLALILLIKPTLKIIKDYDNQIKNKIESPIFEVEKFIEFGIDKETWNSEKSLNKN